jgi:hypothetical protein
MCLVVLESLWGELELQNLTVTELQHLFRDSPWISLSASIFDLLSVFCKYDGTHFASSPYFVFDKVEGWALGSNFFKTCSKMKRNLFRRSKLILR